MKLSLLVWQQTKIADNTNTVSQQNIDETKEEHHADSEICSLSSPSKADCKAKDDPFGQPTEGTNEEDKKVSKTRRLSVSSSEL